MEPASELCTTAVQRRSGVNGYQRRAFRKDAEANLGGTAGCRSLQWGLTAFLFLWAENSTFIRDLDVAKYQWYGAYPALPETEQAS